jgi:hypothetical protein
MLPRVRGLAGDRRGEGFARGAGEGALGRVTAARLARVGGSVRLFPYLAGLAERRVGTRAPWCFGRVNEI